MEALLAGDIGLLLSYFRKAQVVVAEVCGEMVLVVAEEEWGGSGHIAPLGETRAPPRVVFRDWVVLGEIEDKELRFHLSAEDMKDRKGAQKQERESTEEGIALAYLQNTYLVHTKSTWLPT